MDLETRVKSVENYLIKSGYSINQKEGVVDLETRVKSIESYLTKSGYVAPTDVVVPTPIPTPVPSSPQLKGTLIGTAGSWSNKGNTIAKAVDGDLSTFYDGAIADGNWVGYDFGSKKIITDIRYAGRSTQEYLNRMIGGLFQGSNSSDFSNPTTLHTVSKAPEQGKLAYDKTDIATGFRYVRYLSPKGSFGNVAEIQFFGKDDPTPDPKPTPTPIPTPTPSTSIGSNLGPAGDTVTVSKNPWIKNGVTDMQGKRIDILDNVGYTISDNAELKNAYIKTFDARHDPVVNLNGKNAKLTNCTFDDKGGDLLKDDGDGSVISNITASTFHGYAYFGEMAKNTKISGLKVVGGSINESIMRFSHCENVEVSDCYLDYTTANRKACIRGSMTGSIKRVVTKGAIVGMNPLTNADAGEWMCIGEWNGRYGFQWATNKDECLKAVRAAIANGITDTIALSKVAANIAKVTVNGKVLSGNDVADHAASLKCRQDGLQEHTDVYFEDVDISHSIRWASNTKLYFNRGILRATSGQFFDNPIDHYPSTPELTLPQDIVQTKPDIKFENFSFESGTISLSDFMTTINKYGVKINNCKYNGVTI